MNKTWADTHFSTNVARDDVEGWIALDLVRRTAGTSERAARVVFWDAEGQFSLEMFVKEIPVAIVEELISEARQANKVR